jgi:hypothetical protein
MRHLHSDYFFTMGRTHLVCEDYSLRRLTPVPLLVICDGCSASEHSDLGARLLALATQHFFQQHVTTTPPDYHHLGHAVIQQAAEVASQLSTGTEVLDATLMVCFLIGEHIYVYVYGDGVILTRNIAGQIHWQEIEFCHNAPYYLSYWLSEERRAEYAHYSSKPLSLIHSTTGQTEILSYDSPLVFKFSLDDYPTVAIASDGIKQFYRVTPGEMLKIQEVAENVLNFKILEGEFIKRRLLRALQNYAKEGIVPADDFSLAAFAWQEEQTQ